MKTDHPPLKQLGELVRISQGITLSRYKDDEGETVKFLVQVRNLERLYLEDELEQVHLSSSDIKRYELHVNDVVVANRSIPLKASVVTERIAGSLAAQHVAVLRPNLKELNPVYLAIVMRSHWMQQSVASLYTVSVATTSLNISDLSNLQFPLPNLDTQQKIAQLFLSAEKAAQVTLEIVKTRQNLIEGILADVIEGRE